MGAFVKNNELFNKLSNEVQQNFGKIKPIGKFLNDNARIIVEVIDDETLRITYRSMIFFAAANMIPIINEVENKNAVKAASEITEQIAKKLDVKIKLRDEFIQETTEMLPAAPRTTDHRGYYRWTTLADVKPPKKSED